MRGREQTRTAERRPGAGPNRRGAIRGVGSRAPRPSGAQEIATEADVVITTEADVTLTTEA